MAHLKTTVVDAGETNPDHVKETFRIRGATLLDSVPQGGGQVGAPIEDVNRNELALMVRFVLLLYRSR
jgi:hypothetical protein